MKLRKALKYIGLSKERKKRRKRKSSKAVLWEKADDINSRLEKLIKLSSLPYNIKTSLHFAHSIPKPVLMQEYGVFQKYGNYHYIYLRII